MKKDGGPNVKDAKRTRMAKVYTQIINCVERLIAQVLHWCVKLLSAKKFPKSLGQSNL